MLCASVVVCVVVLCVVVDVVVVVVPAAAAAFAAAAAAAVLLLAAGGCSRCSESVIDKTFVTASWYLGVVSPAKRAAESRARLLLMWLLQWCLCLLWLLRWLWLSSWSSSWSTHAWPWWCCWGLANFAHGRDKRFYQFQIETECDGKRGGIGGVISRPVWDQQRNKMLWQTRGIRRRNFQPVSDIQC